MWCITSSALPTVDSKCQSPSRCRFPVEGLGCILCFQLRKLRLPVGGDLGRYGFYSDEFVIEWRMVHLPVGDVLHGEIGNICCVC